MAQRTTSTRSGAVDPAEAPARDALPAVRFAPLPDESLDALVTVLDEIRLGRSRSRSELVARTGLGRAIVAQRVGELIERGLVAEGDVGPEHRRTAAPPARVPCRRGPRARRRPRRDEHRRRGHDARRPDPRSPRRAGPHRRRARALPRPRRRPSSTSSCGPRTACPGRLWGIGIGVPGPGRVPVRSPDLAADHARLGRLPDPRPVRGPLRGTRLGRQRRQPARPRRVALRCRDGPRQRRRRQDRDGDRGRDHLRRPAPSRRPGQRRRRRPHPGRRRPVGRLPLRQHRLPRGARRGRGARPGRRGGGARRPKPATAGGPRPGRGRDRGGRRPGGLVRRSGRRRADPVGRPARRARCSRASSTSSTRR